MFDVKATAYEHFHTLRTPWPYEAAVLHFKHKISSGILHVNRKVYTEASALLYAKNALIIVVPGSGSDLTLFRTDTPVSSGIIHPHIFSMLSRIEICLPYIGSYYDPFQRYDMNILTEVLRILCQHSGGDHSSWSKTFVMVLKCQPSEHIRAPLRGGRNMNSSAGNSAIAATHDKDKFLYWIFLRTGVIKSLKEIHKTRTVSILPRLSPASQKYFDDALSGD